MKNEHDQLIKEGDYWDKKDVDFVVNFLSLHWNSDSGFFLIPIEGESRRKEFLTPSQAWSRFAPPPNYRFWSKADPHSIEMNEYIKRMEQVEKNLFQFITEEVGWDLRKEGVHTDW